jgi:hypothetical protein
MVTSRVLFTAAQKAELWERWKNGQSAAAISRALERTRLQRPAIAASNSARATVIVRPSGVAHLDALDCRYILLREEARDCSYATRLRFLSTND